MMPPIEELRRDFIAIDRTVPVVDWKPGALTHLGPCVAVIGAFDGVHLGHRSLIAAATEEAGHRGMASVAVTFMPDPDEVVAPRPDPKLCMSDDRLALLASSGVDAVLVIPFTVELSKHGHAEFFQRVLLPACDIRSSATMARRPYRLWGSGARARGFPSPVMNSWPLTGRLSPQRIFASTSPRVVLSARSNCWAVDTYCVEPLTPGAERVPVWGSLRRM